MFSNTIVIQSDKRVDLFVFLSTSFPRIMPNLLFFTSGVLFDPLFYVFKRCVKQYWSTIGNIGLDLLFDQWFQLESTWSSWMVTWCETMTTEPFYEIELHQPFVSMVDRSCISQDNEERKQALLKEITQQIFNRPNSVLTFGSYRIRKDWINKTNLLFRKRDGYSSTNPFP
jgi:hypothetical protein